ncbi:flagellar filament capping protein FliD [Rickettsiales endosymbiont of Stachyamoeba lipophora]|uniref:flagellar filament capping protein FliD n=1 Tax=Rickettsiales endosymbiont of Stachyamoeba lipophora TaxID=2486578 RepID=UPI000F6541C1|nr:flagellar filament capping protein FliD [Rickettsiales endosymbiont of Stachyamoeba lipophora]AZL14955.1 hypothetical protein EF513_00010 [Rickettsiales endosymbiont of Stachyamoeba lipophora]
MPAINFGSIATVGDKTIASGMASGMNSKDIINGLVDAKKIGLKKIEDKINVNDKKINAFNQMRKSLSKVYDAVNKLRNVPSVDKSDNAFSARKTTVSNINANANEVFVKVSAANDAEISSYDITIDELAKAKIQTSNSFASLTSSVVNASGTGTANFFEAGILKINGVDVHFTQGQNLNDIKSAINAASKDTNVKASVLKVGTGDYRLILQSTLTGIANAYTLTDTGTVINNITLTNTQLPLDAQITLNTIPISRPINTMSDVIERVTFDLVKKTGVGESVNVEIEPNSQKAYDTIIEFITAFNDFKIFIAKQTERISDPEKGSKFAPNAALGRDDLVSFINDSLLNEITGMAYGLTNSALNNLGELGIKLLDYDDPDSTYDSDLNTNTILGLDEDVLNMQLVNNFDEVRKIFEYDFVASSSALRILSRKNNIQTNAFSLVIDTSQANPEDQVKATYNPGTGPVTISMNYTGTATSGKIEGAEGTVLDGISIYYYGSGVLNADISFSQGIADRIYNFLEEVLTEEGMLDLRVESVIDSSRMNNQEIEKKNREIKEYRNRLIEKYAKMEKTIDEFNTVLMMIDAQNDAQNKR